MVLCAIRSSAMPVALLLACVLVVGLTACAEKQPADAPVAKTVSCVNGTCPIMGSAIDPAKVPVSLTRDFKGQKVGFCCAGCPDSWDKLTDEEKTAKLATAMAKAAVK